MTDFSPLLALSALESLSVTGSLWTRQQLDSLEPFAQMTWLRSLTLDTTGLSSLRPLAALTNLRELGLGGRLPLAEYAWLSARLPDTACRWFAPYLEMAGSGLGPCVKCQGDTKAMLTGRGGGVICRVCDHAKLQKHEEAYATARARALAGD